MAGMYMPLFGLSAERGALIATLATLTNLRYVLEPGGFILLRLSLGLDRRGVSRSGRRLGGTQVRYPYAIGGEGGEEVVGIYTYSNAWSELDRW